MYVQKKNEEERSPEHYWTHKALEHAHEIHKSTRDNTKEASTRSQACPAFLLSPLMCALVVNKKGWEKEKTQKKSSGDCLSGQSQREERRRSRTSGRGRETEPPSHP